MHFKLTSLFLMLSQAWERNYKTLPSVFIHTCVLADLYINIQGTISPYLQQRVIVNICIARHYNYFKLLSKLSHSLLNRRGTRICGRGPGHQLQTPTDLGLISRTTVHLNNIILRRGPYLVYSFAVTKLKFTCETNVLASFFMNILVCSKLLLSLRPVITINCHVTFSKPRGKSKEKVNLISMLILQQVKSCTVDGKACTRC